MADPVNLNKARKAKARAGKVQSAAENRQKFGRTKAQKALEKSAGDKLKKATDEARRER